MTTILEQAMKLSPEDKLALISTLWDQLAQQPAKIPVPDWHQEELARRIEAQQANPQSGQSWEEVKREIVDDAK